MIRHLLCQSLAYLLLALTGCGDTQPLQKNVVLTVKEARTLPTAALANRLVGPLLGSRVIEAVRREYPLEGGTPREVDLFSKPELAWPRFNGICRTDVITIEYNWFHHGSVSDATPLEIAHVEAVSRYKAFPMPPGEPGSVENDNAQLEQCAKMTTALDAFRAPSAGAAQWLAKIAQDYLRETERDSLPFTCDDFQDRTCRQARIALRNLTLDRATDVNAFDCPKLRTSDQVTNCYRLSFPYPDDDHIEWEIAVRAGMRDGMAPVEIRSFHLVHQRKPMVLY